MHYVKNKKLLSLVAIIVLVFLLVVTVIVLQKQQVYRNNAATANPYTGIHVVGNQFQNALGQTIHVHGANVTQMFYGNAGVCNTINNQTIDAIATWNINWVRLWISASDWLANTNCGGGVTYQTVVMNNIHRIESDGMIAEPTFVSDTPLDGNGHTAGLSNLGLQFWTSFAPFISTEPAVALDLINEPIGTADSAAGWKCLFQGMTSGTCNQGAGANWNGSGQYQYIGYNQVISVIRAAGFTGPIGTPGTNYARGATGFQTYAPTNAGIYLPYHEYEAFSTAPALLTQLGVNWNQFPVLLEEFQGSQGDPWLDTVMQGIENGQGVGYAVWQWGNDGSNDGLQVVQPATCATCYFGTGQDYHDHIATQPSLTGAGVTTTIGPTFTPTPTLASGATSPIYTDSLATNWIDWSWSDVDNFANTSPVYSGTDSIAFSITGAWGALYLHDNDTNGINTSQYANLQFAAQATQTGQKYFISLADMNGNFINQTPLTNYGDPPVGSWKLYTIPLSALAGTGAAVSGIVIEDASGGTQPNLYVDNISFSNPGGITPTSGATPTNTPIPTVTPTPSPTPTQQYIFDDEFNGTALDTNAWIPLNRGPDTSNNESQCYLSSNQAVSGGFLTLTSKRDTTGCQAAGVGNYSYSSEMVQWKSFNFTYGRIDVRAKETGGQGPWPAIWLLGSNCQGTNPTSADNIAPCNWPNAGSDEIDIAEFKNSNFTTVNQNNISGGSGWLICTPTTTDTSQNYHVFSLNWTPGRLQYLIDNVVTCTQTSGVPTTPMFLIINTAMGGLGGTITNSTLPVTHTIDYVRVTANGTTTPTPIPTNTPIPTPTRTPTPTATTVPTPTRTPTPVPTNTPVPPTNTPTPVSAQTMLSYTVLLHGIGSAGDSVTPGGGGGNTTPLHPTRSLTLTLFDASNNVAAVVPASMQYNSTGGNFQGTVALPTTLPSGVYLVKLVTPTYLSKTLSQILTITQHQTTTVPTTSLVVGDSNNDNQLSLLDYNLLLGCFGSSASSCSPSDLNDDGIVNGADYNLFLRELSVQIGG